MASVGQLYVDPNTGTRIEVLSTSASSGGRTLAFDVTHQPNHGKEANTPHFHLTFDERFEIVEGVAGYVLNDQEILAKAGETIVISRNTKHLNPYNAGDASMRMIHKISLDTPNPRTLEAFENAFDTFAKLARENKMRADGHPKSFLQFAVVIQSLQPHSYAAGIPIPAQRAMFGFLGGLGRLFGYKTKY